MYKFLKYNMGKGAFKNLIKYLGTSISFEIPTTYFIFQMSKNGWDNKKIHNIFQIFPLKSFWFGK